MLIPEHMPVRIVSGLKPSAMAVSMAVARGRVAADARYHKVKPNCLCRCKRLDRQCVMQDRIVQRRGKSAKTT